MIQPLMIDRGSRILVEQIAVRTATPIPVIIEMTAARRGAMSVRQHVDTINYFEGVMERLDGTMPGGWRRDPAWGELDRDAGRDGAPRRLYLYVQARIGLADVRRIDAAAAEIARTMNVRYGLAVAPGRAMVLSEFARRGIRDVHKELLGLVADDPDRRAAPGRYSVRMRWTAAAATGRAADGGRGAPPRRVYLTLLQRRSAPRRRPARPPRGVAPASTIRERRAAPTTAAGLGSDRSRSG